MNAHELINQDSGDTEYYTPEEIVEAARRAMGGIDLDPASSEAANKRVGALRYFTRADDGLSREWCGRIWMNHPFSRAGSPAWVSKLDSHWRDGDISAACCITFAATSEKWFQPLLRYPQCFLSPRTNYYLPDGTKKRGVTKGSVVTYMGPDLASFEREFSRFGWVK